MNESNKPHGVSEGPERAPGSAEKMQSKPADRPPPPAPNDEADQRLAAAVRLVICPEKAGGASPEDWQIAASGGMIVLTGNVESEAERRTATSRIKSVPGVAGIDNRLVVRKG